MKNFFAPMQFFRKTATLALVAAGVSTVGVGTNVVELFAQDSTINVSKILVDDSVRGATPELGADGSFSVGVRVQFLAPGSEKGNGDSLGMIFNVATGWNDGFRAHYNWNSGQITFQIGRVAEQSAVSVGTNRAVFPGVWNDVVCVFNGKSNEMNLYVDGEKAGSATFSGSIETNGAPLNVGFGGSGVGSNRMFVDRLDYWKRALTSEEIADRFETEFPKDEVRKKSSLEAFRNSGVAAEVGLDDATYETVLALEIPDDFKTQIRRSRLEQLLLKGDFEKASILASEEADDLLKLDSNDENQPFDAVRSSRIANAVAALEKIARSSGSASLRDVADDKIRRLAERSPRVFATVKKIDALRNSADAVRRVESDALKRFQNVAKTLEQNVAKPGEIKICVAPNGSDENAGSATAPVATLARAFELAQEFAASAPEKTMLVELADGVYRVEKTATLSGVSNVLVRPASGANAVLTGAVELDSFQTLRDAATANETVADAAKRFQESVRGSIFVADLSAAGISDFGRLANRGYGTGDQVAPIPSLYVDGEAQRLARWPNAGDEALQLGQTTETSSDVPNAPKKTTYRYDFDRPNGWKSTGNADVDDVWAFGLFEYEWAANFRRIDRIDRAAKTLTVDYPNGNAKFHYYFVNVLEELDAPGEYFVDKENGVLYFLPPQEIASTEKLAAAQVEFDVFSTVFIDVERSKNVVLQNLELRGGRESGVRFRDCESAYFVGGKIEEFGGNAALLLDGKYCGVLDSRLRELGACGVRASGGDRSQLVRANHLITNCWIADFSRIDRVYAPAVHFSGCGIAITNNLIADSPHHAMRTDGNDIYVARNEVHSVVYEYSDQAGIDIYCDPSYRGIVIEKNLWRHIGSPFALCGQAGIRLDDSISGVIMTENVFYRSSGGMFGGIQIHGGKDNLCEGNLFVDCKQAFSFSDWAPERYLKFVREQFPQNVGNKKYLETYPFFDEILKNPNRNFIIDNDVVHCDRFNQGGGSQNLFANNRSREIEPIDPTTYYNDANALRAKLEEIGGKSLKEIGLRENWKNVDASVSPHYLNAK